MHLLLKREKCCYKGVEDIGVYEQMLKVGLRFLLSARHRHLFQYLGLVVTQISPNAWRVFLGAEVLYGWCLTRHVGWRWKSSSIATVRLKSHSQEACTVSCWGTLLLRLVCDTLDSNRNWKSHYFFIQGHKWMCHHGDQEYMPGDNTWGIMPPSGMYPSVWGLNFCLTFLIF